jgi:hypothetical protein
MATRVTSSAFVGRVPELAELEAAFRDAAEGHPSLAFVAGESGVGKSRLLAELDARVTAAGALVLAGDCVELGAGELPYAPIVAALRPLVRDGGADALARLPPALRAELAAVVPGLGAIPASRAAPGSEPPGAAQGRLFEALLALVGELATRAPLVLVVEDLHWADSSTRAFLAFLARSLCRERLLLVASYRADELHRRHPLRPLLAELEREPRARPDRAAAAHAARARRAARGDPRRRAAVRPRRPACGCARRATRCSPRSSWPPASTGRGGPAADAARRAHGPHGAPAAAAQDGRAGCWPSGGGWTTSCSRPAGVLQPPGAARGAARGGRPPTSSEASAGRDLRLPPRAPARGRPGRPACRASARTCTSRWPGDGGRAAGAGGAHLTVGIAHHYQEAGDRPAALAAAVRAGHASARVHAHGEAAGLFERALELWDKVPDAEALAGTDRVDLLVRAARARTMGNELSRAEALLRTALDGVDAEADPERAATVMERLSHAQWHLGRQELGPADRGRRAGAPPGRRGHPGAGGPAVVAGEGVHAHGPLPPGRGHAEEALEVAVASGHRWPRGAP